MSQQVVCDFCQKTIKPEDAKHKVQIENWNPLDVCEECMVSPIILSEQRRTRTRHAKVEKPVVKRGRKSKKELELLAQQTKEAAEKIAKGE